MKNILDCVNAFEALLDTRYKLVLGRKGVAVSLCVEFDKKDCYHLVGLQYLKDRPELSRDRGKVFDEIISGKISLDDKVICSEEAASMGGSQIWLEERRTIKC